MTSSSWYLFCPQASGTCSLSGRGSHATVLLHTRFCHYILSVSVPHRAGSQPPPAPLWPWVTLDLSCSGEGWAWPALFWELGEANTYLHPDQPPLWVQPIALGVTQPSPPWLKGRERSLLVARQDSPWITLDLFLCSQRGTLGVCGGGGVEPGTSLVGL